MSYGMIDSASIMGAVGALSSYQRVSQWGDWARKSIDEVTQTLFLYKYLQIAPGPSIPRPRTADELGSLYTYYDKACVELSNCVTDTAPSNKRASRIRKSVLIEFKNWLTKNLGEVRNVIELTKSEEGYQQWIQWAVENAFVGHSTRLNGLFDLEIADQLSQILQVDPEVLTDLWHKTTSIPQVELWSKGKSIDRDFELAKEAFVAAAVLRGRYHDLVASRMDWAYMHHPIRQYVLSPIKKAEYYNAPEALSYLVSIVISGAMEEKKPDQRVCCWTENLSKVQNALMRNETNRLRGTSTIKELDALMDSQSVADKACDNAIVVAKRLNIRLYPLSLQKYIDWAVLIGTTAVGMAPGIVVNEPWVSITGGTIGALASKAGMKKSLGKRLAQKIALADGHLHQLAQAEPGRIRWVWKKLANNFE